MKSDSVLVGHILESSERIQRFIDDLTYQAFEKDEKTISAVVRELTVIGEAASNLSGKFSDDHDNIPLYEVVGMRNRIVHEYWAVDTDVVWKTCTEDIPRLKHHLESL